jgi:hypothetical protein
VRLASIDADNLDSAAPGTLGTARAHVVASGSWSAVMRALKLAEDLPYLVTVSGLSVTLTDGSAAAKRTWQATFDIKTPILRK